MQIDLCYFCYTFDFFRVSPTSGHSLTKSNPSNDSVDTLGFPTFVF